MQNVMMSLVPVSMALVLAGIAVFCRKTATDFRRKAISADAVVVGFTTQADSPRPIVRFESEDGETCVKPAQSFGRAASRASTGSQVKIMYARKKVFGGETWNIFITSGENSANPYRVYNVIAAMLGVLALGLLSLGCCLLLA